MNPITINPILYVLKLEGNNYYVGITYNLNLRWAQHCAGEGSKWTKEHKPVSIIDIRTVNTTLEGEKKLTLRYMKKYGWQRVRGASWCQIEMSKPPSCL